MSINLLINIGLNLSLIGVSLLTSIQPSKATDNKYFCAVFKGIPRTFVRTERGNMILVSWVQGFSQTWTPLRRCVEVSRRFQRFYDNGILRYIGTGEINNTPVLCALHQKEENCQEKNILITLPVETDATQVARQLMDIRSLARGRTIEVNGKKDKLETYIDGKTYYDLEVVEKIVNQQHYRDRLIEENLTPVETY
jgi:hypothetical protein